MDRTDTSYRRFERPALGHPVFHPDSVDWGAQLLGYPNSVRGSAWVLDVWTGDAGFVERIRLQAQEYDQHWAELRFAEGGVAGHLPGPDGTSRLGYAPSCPTTDAEEAAAGWLGFEPWEAKVETPVDATLDPSGRPYDATTDGAQVSRQALGTLVATDRSVFVTDAFYLPEELGQGIAAGVEFDAAPPGDIVLDATVLATTTPGSSGRQLYGIRLDVPSTTVDRWTEFETAYCTDGGTGRISSWRSLEQQGDVGEDVFGPDVWLGDDDDRAGNDTIVFSNGFGDGCFPMSRGLDSQGGTVALVVWNPIYPWRLMMPDGTPPPDVLRREAEIQECLEGRRAVVAWGYCLPSEG